MKLMMNKLVLWLLIPAIAMGSWVAPAAGADRDIAVLQADSTAGDSPAVAQVEATPVVTEPEAPAPASSDPASTSPAKDSGPTTVAPADFPNVCDGSPATLHPVTFTVEYPAGITPSPLEVRIFAENGGCIPEYGYAGPVLNFPDKSGSYEPQAVYLPAGRYVYEYSGDGFVPESRVPFQVDGVEDNVTITPEPIPASYEVSVNVTLPDGGSSMTVVVSDANGTIEGWTVPASDGSETDKHTLKLPVGDYFYEYWGDDYPWSDRIPFSVTADGANTIDINPVIASITLNPQQGPVGSEVSVTVSGFRAGDEYDISFNGDVLTRGNVANDGTITNAFNVPDLPEGKYPVVVTGAVSGQRVEATFTVAAAAQLTVEPASAPAGDIVRVNGSGYGPNEQVDIRWDSADGLLRGRLTANNDGAFTGRITIPTSTFGEHQIVATGTSGQQATAPFTVTERIVNVTVSPTSVTPGTVVTVTGSGFRSGEIVDIRWGSTTGPLLGYRTVDSSGSFTGRVTVPTTASAGDHALVATGRTTSATASAPVTVTGPQVSVSPTSQTSGKVVGVSGSGFASNKRVDIRWNSPSGKLIGYLTANSSGSVSGKVTVPAGTVPGDYSIVMVQPDNGLSGSATLQVTGATVQVAPSEASPGTVVSVSGSGFEPNEVVDIRWNGPAGTLLGYRTTTSTGAMSGKVTIPKSAAPGTYTLHLQGRGSGIVGSVTVVIQETTSLDYPQADWQGHAKRNHIAVSFEPRQAG